MRWHGQPEMLSSLNNGIAVGTGSTPVPFQSVSYDLLHLDLSFQCWGITQRQSECAAHLGLEEVVEEGHCLPCIRLISPDPQNGVVGDDVGLHMSPQQLLEQLLHLLVSTGALSDLEALPWCNQSTYSIRPAEHLQQHCRTSLREGQPGTQHDMQRELSCLLPLEHATRRALLTKVHAVTRPQASSVLPQAMCMT